jgi:5-formyltetrahydrofolate cyclo-ligase
MDKQSLRLQAMLHRDALDGREWRSMAICEAVQRLPVYASARAIHCYLAMRSEVDTRPLIARALQDGKGVVVPVVVPRAAELSHAWLDSLEADALAPGVFGTFNPRASRPATHEDWDLAIVPLLAFDRRGYRLGYGKGFYDRLLSISPAITVGVAFAAQEVHDLPVEAHDVPLDWIVTENEVIVTRLGA